MPETGVQISLIVVVGTFVSLLFVFSVLVFVSVYQNRSIKHQEQLHKLAVQQAADKLNISLQAQELERERISRELHDGMGLPLSAVKLSLYEIGKKFPEGSAERQMIKEARENMNTIIEQTRNLSHNLLSGSLDVKGLEIAIEELCDQARKAYGLEVTFNKAGNYLRQHPDRELMVYRIVQELLQNVGRHAAANTCEVNMLNTPEAIEISVSDNGKGFDSSEQYHGIGLRNIRNRVSTLDAKFYIASAPNRGTIATIVYKNEPHNVS